MRVKSHNEIVTPVFRVAGSDMLLKKYFSFSLCLWNPRYIFFFDEYKFQKNTFM